MHAHPRTDHFKEDIIQAFCDGIKHRPESTFGNVKADVLAGFAQSGRFNGAWHHGSYAFRHGYGGYYG